MQNKIFYIVLVGVVGIFLWAIAPTSDQSVGGQQAQSAIDLTNFSKGNKDAPVQLVQYSDFLCPSCSQVSLGVIPEIVKNYVNTGDVYFVFKPLAFIAAGSQIAAEGAFCAADQNKFWDYHDESYQTVWQNYFSKGVDPSQVPLYSLTGVKELGKASGVDSTTFDDCINNRTKMNDVANLTKESQANGVTGTPYFEVSGTPIKGAPTYQVLEAAIKAKL